MPLPQRKRLRLLDYDYSAPGAYFVTICTRSRRCILSHIPVGAAALGGPPTILSDAGQVVEKYLLSSSRSPGVHIDNYVIMPNHVHLLIRIENPCGPPGAAAPTASLPRIISGFKRLVNKELGTNIWQRSFHDHIIRGDADYREIWQYIETNPARWRADRLYCAED